MDVPFNDGFEKQTKNVRSVLSDWFASGILRFSLDLQRIGCIHCWKIKVRCMLVSYRLFLLRENLYFSYENVSYELI